MDVVYGWMDLELSIVKAGVAHLQSTPSRSTDGGGGLFAQRETNKITRKIKGKRDLTD